MELNNVRVNASKVNSDNTVLINLSGGGDAGKKRISVGVSLTLRELGVDPARVKAEQPQFPQAEVNRVTASGLTGQEKAERITQITAAFSQAAAAWAAKGAGTVEEQIIDRTMKYLVREHGFTTDNKVTDKPYIKSDELQVSAIPVGETILFQVVGSTGLYIQ